MRVTTQLATQLGLLNRGYLASPTFRPLILGDLYTNKLGDEIPDNFQLLATADQLIAWWATMTTSDNLSNQAALVSNLQHYSYVAQSLLSNGNRTIAWKFETPVSAPRELRISIWDTSAPTSILYLVLAYPDDSTVQSMKANGKLWRADWDNMLTFTNMYALAYNGVITYRNAGVWTTLDHGSIPSTAG